MKTNFSLSQVWETRKTKVEKWHYKFRISMLFLLFTLIGWNAKAQYTVVVGPATSAISSYNYGPVFRSAANSSYYYSMYSYVYTAAEIAAAGISNGNRIDSIKFKLNTAAVLKANNKLNVEVWLKNSTINNLSANTTWNNTISGATLKMKKDWDNTNPGASGWVSFKFNSGFIYTGGSLVVSIRTQLTGTATMPFSSFGFFWDCASGSSIPSLSTIGIASNNVLSGNSTLGTAIYSGNFRPLTQMVYSVIGASCNGTPSPGNTLSSVNVACPNVNFDLSTQNITQGSGVSYQWQSASNANFTSNLVNLGTNPSQTVSQTSARYYRCKVTCSGSSSFSNPVFVGMDAAMNCYCTPATIGNNTYIIGVSTSGGSQNINNSSNYSVGGYGDYFNSFTTSQTQGGIVNFSVTSTGLISGKKIWVDWNQNGDFEDQDELVFTSSSFSSIHNGSFQVPINANIGNTRMRVGAALNPYTGPDGPCEIAINGEYEDYKFNVTQAPSCNGMPTAGTASATVSSICINTSFNLKTLGATAGVGINGIWQESIDGGTTWTDIAGSTNNTNYNLLTGITQNTSFRYKNTCSNSNQTSFSNVVNVVIYNFNYAVYNGISFFEGFENWASGCSSNDRPSTNWINNPVSGNNSWRRNDQGNNGAWSNSSSGSYAPASSEGNYSARFHSSIANLNQNGFLTFFLDMSINNGNPSNITRLSFDYINPSGSDMVKVFVSTDGGITMTQLGPNLGVSTSWSNKTFDFSSTSSKTIIQIEAISDQGTSDIGIDNFNLSPVPTPIFLDYFKGKIAGASNILDWKASVEQNADYYSVERSVDGKLFTEIGRVKAQNKNGSTYQYSDLKPNNYDNFYRLRMKSFDSKENYSNIVKLTKNLNEELTLTVVPNPVKETIKVGVKGLLSPDATIAIVDIVGRVVYSQKVTQSEFTIDMGSLNAGIYLIHFKDNSTNKVIKIVKE
ncbi:MAG TPA: GEVED domain-containing protein [Edaphocola sp.]|nr:GEVED domain-containing protein [Edaphocola sp.]